MYGFIYVTTCLINGKRYIGKCSYKRKCWPTYLGSGKWLLKAVKKYGTKNFTRVIIEECSDAKSLSDRENYYINHYDAANSRDWYNIYSQSTPNQSFLGRKHTSERNAKVAEKLRGRKRPPHVGMAVARANRLRKMSDQTKAKHKEFRDTYGHPKAKIVVVDGVQYKSMTQAMATLEIGRNELLRRIKNTKAKPNHKPVTIHGITYDSISHAMRALNLSRAKVKAFL